METSKFAFIGSIIGLAFAYGVAVGIYHVFPYQPLHNSFNAIKTVWAEAPTILGLRPDHFLEPARVPGDSVTRWNETATAPGLTLLSGFFGGRNELRLIRLDGSVVQRWAVSFHALFPDPSHIDSREVPATEWNTSVHGALALPDGSIVFNFEAGGTVHLDRCGRTLWTLSQRSHHSIERAHDGSFFIPGMRQVERREDSPTPVWSVPFREDLILHVSAEGVVLDIISVPALMVDNDLLGVLTADTKTFVSIAGEDALHLNDIEPLSPALADAFPAFTAGDLLVSVRNLNLILVVDPRTRRIKWYHTGPWIRQHDPDFRPDGTISVFDNRRDGTPDGSRLGGSRILQIDPATDSVGVLFSAAPGSFHTDIRGRHQLLGNGNLLLLESTQGRVLEVDSAGTIVWEYVNRYDEKRAAMISDAVRYDENYFTVESWACE